MTQYFQYAALFCVLISYISSLRAFRLDMPLLYKQFSFFLLFMFVGDGFGFSWRWIHQYFGFTNNTHWFYYFFYIATYLFYLYFFHETLKLRWLKSLVKTSAVVYFIFTMILIYYLRFKGINYNYLFASVLMVFLSIAYYFQLLREKDPVPLKYDMAFWICTGIFIHHLGSSLLVFVSNILYSRSSALAHALFIIVPWSAIGMYLSYTIGYLCQKKLLLPRQ